MTAGSSLRRVGTGALLLLLPLAVHSAVFAAGDDPARVSLPSAQKPTVAQLRAVADAAEKAGDWDSAFTAYCRLFVVDRNAPEIREKLNLVLRRVQQLRRHRDPQFLKFAAVTSVSDALNLVGEVFAKVPAVYVDRDRCTPQVLWASGIEELAHAMDNPSFRQAFLSGEKKTDKLDELRAGLRFWAKQPVADARAARATLRKLITAAQEAAPIKVPAAIVLEVVCGACSGLDEFTVFLTPAATLDSSAVQSDLTPQGVYLEFADGELTIAGIATGSWAAVRTRLRKGDRVVRLNKRAMDMATPLAVAEALRSPVDGMHVLEVEAKDLDDGPVVDMLPVIVPTVYGEEDLRDGIGYLRIGSFAPSTPRELDAAIATLKAQGGVRALILDLRGNLGGSFLASVETAKRLIPSGLIVTTQGQLAEVANRPFSSDSGMTAHDIPLVVLIDAETASAAEVLAAALKDNHRATLVGMPTFGKGTVQYPLKLSTLDDMDDAGKAKAGRSGTVRLTIAKLIAPQSGPINGVGVTPHILEADPIEQFRLAHAKSLEQMPMSPMLSTPSRPSEGP